MKNGTQYAKTVKRTFTALKKRHGTPDEPEATEPIQQLIVGVLAQASPKDKVNRAVSALNRVMVDFNEIRVSTTPEVARVIRPHIRDAEKWADEIRRALNAVYLKKHALTLDFLHKLGRRDARQWLERLDGVSADTAASIILWSLGGHAIPVGERLLDALRQAELVEPSATIDEVRAFLERNVSASDAKAFCLLMDRFAGKADAKQSSTGRRATKKRATADAAKRKKVKRATAQKR